MKQIYTKCHSFEEANALGHFIMSKGYEGVQKDSYRYCEDHIRWALEYNRRHHREYCFVGVNGGCMVVGKDKKEMRRKLSIKYIEKERIFRELLSMASDFSRFGKVVKGIKHLPERIYLNIGDGVPDDADFRDLSEVTWSEERINDNDIEYVIGKEVEG